MNLDNCHGCGSRERPTDLSRPAWNIGQRFCPDCLELDSGYLEYIATQPPHYPLDINDRPMTKDQLEAWGLPLTGWRPATYTGAWRPTGASA